MEIDEHIDQEGRKRKEKTKTVEREREDGRKRIIHGQRKRTEEEQITVPWKNHNVCQLMRDMSRNRKERQKARKDVN
jgi:hypothetical protein